MGTGAGNISFGNTKGNKRRKGGLKMNLQLFANKAFNKDGSVSEDSFEKHREFFLGKSANKISKEMKKLGYETEVTKSKNKKSKAKKVIVKNNDKQKNVSMVLVSPGSKRHGETAYVKVSTTNAGTLKVVAYKDKYKSDGKETAKVYYARRKK